MPFRLVLTLIAALAAAGAAEARAASSSSPSLILFSGQGYEGRQAFYSGGQAQAVDPGFKARSAVSTGMWTLCDGRAPASRCQTVDGPAARLKVAPRIVRPGVNAVALYDKPGLRGRRVIYSFASDQPPPFRARSARSWGGAWSICPASRGRCETIDGARMSLDMNVAGIRPGRAPERLQIVMAAPQSSPPVPRPAAQPPRARPPAPSKPPPEMIAKNDRSRPAPAALARNDRAPPAVATAQSIPLPPLPKAFPRAAEPFAYEPPAPPPRPEQLAQAAPPPRTRPAAPTQVDYACEDGRSLIVVFDPRSETAEVLSQDEDPVVLDRTTARRGFRYQSWNRAFYGDRVQATYEDRGGEPVDCRAVQPRRSFGEP